MKLEAIAAEVATTEATKAKDWTLDAEARIRIDAAYAEIEAAQSGYPKCVVCDQRSMRLDKFGTCSKVSERSDPHRQHRNEYRTAAPG